MNEPPKVVNLWTWRRLLRDHGPESQGVLVTLYTIGTYMDGDGFAFPGQPLIAKGARVSERTVRRHIKAAVAAGWLHVEPGPCGGQGWRRHVYRSVVPAHVNLAERDEILADVVISQVGDIERADTAMAAPLPETCGHSEHEGADISGQRADTGDQTCGHSYGRLTLHRTLHKNSSEEGAPQSAALLEDDEKLYTGRSKEEPQHVSNVLPDQTSANQEVRHGDESALPDGISEFKRAAVLKLAQDGREPALIATMAGIAPDSVAELLREAL